MDTAREVARLYGYHEMATPIFEFTELFARGVGETTDIVEHLAEMIEKKAAEIEAAKKVEAERHRAAAE